MHGCLLKPNRKDPSVPDKRYQYLIFNNLVCPTRGWRLSYLFFFYIRSSFQKDGCPKKVSQTSTFGRDCNNALKHTQPSCTSRVVCPLITGEPKDATDIVRYRERLLHIRKFIVSSTKNPSPQQFLRAPMSNIINSLYIQTT